MEYIRKSAIKIGSEHVNLSQASINYLVSTGRVTTYKMNGVVCLELSELVQFAELGSLESVEYEPVKKWMKWVRQLVVFNQWRMPITRAAKAMNWSDTKIESLMSDVLESLTKLND